MALMYVDSESLQLLAEWNLLALVLVAAGIGAAVGWFPHVFLIVLVMVGGVWLLQDGYSRWQQLRLVEDTTTEPVRSVAAGRTEVYGTCEPVEEPLDRPFSEGKCVLANWEIEEHRNDDWTTIASELRYVPFVIDDGTGSIRVDPPADATVKISDRNRTEITVGGTRFSSDEPDEVVSFLESTDGVEVPGTGLLFRPQRRYTERVLPPGEEAYVLGSAVIREDAEGSNPERLVLSDRESAGEFIISDRRQQKFVDFDRRLARNEVGMGATLIVAFLAAAAVRGEIISGAEVVILLLVALGVFLYGRRFKDWW